MTDLSNRNRIENSLFERCDLFKFSLVELNEEVD